MSPLARSLLVLAVILATDGKVIQIQEPPGSRCTGFTTVVIPIMNYQKVMETAYEFQSQGDEPLHNIVDDCKRLGLKVASQTVRACNGYNRPSAHHWFSPTLSALGEDILSPVYASCESNPECKPIKFYVLQTCI